MSKKNNSPTEYDDISRIIVMGASIGGFEAFKKIVSSLPPDFRTPIFIVWHMSPDTIGILPEVLNRLNGISVANAYNDEKIVPGRIYVAPPDHHLIIEDGFIRLTHGPKENRFRPAIDPLFHSAAYSYGNGVIGIILSGALDDGTAGLWTVKQQGGIAIVQDPMDAEVPSMPKNAMRQVKIDHVVAVDDLADLLVQLVAEPPPELNNNFEDDLTHTEINIGKKENVLKHEIMDYGEHTPFTCPVCHGVLTRLQSDNIIRFSCHTGHTYSIDSLLTTLTERIEDALYNAIRGIDESTILLNHLGDHYAAINQPKLAALYFKKAKDVSDRSNLVRRAAMTQELINNESLRREVEKESLDTGKYAL